MLYWRCLLSREFLTSFCQHRLSIRTLPGCSTPTSARSHFERHMQSIFMSFRQNCQIFPRDRVLRQIMPAAALLCMDPLRFHCSLQGKSSVGNVMYVARGLFSDDLCRASSHGFHRSDIHSHHYINRGICARGTWKAEGPMCTNRKFGCSAASFQYGNALEI